MKIQDPNVSGLSTGGVGKAAELEGSRQAKRAEQAQSQSGDSVALSGLSAALAAAQSESPERAAQLEKLSLEVESGRYKVDAKQLARAVIKDAFQGE
jgi:anti-sigma28 factor (negative regulator of flagellin synthesis)